MKNCTRLLKAKQPKKSYEFFYDEVSECMVFRIYDTEGMLPLIIKGEFAKPYKLERAGANGLVLH